MSSEVVTKGRCLGGAVFTPWELRAEVSLQKVTRSE